MASKKRKAPKRVGMSTEDALACLIVDVMRLQNQYAELVRSMQAMHSILERATHPSRRFPTKRPRKKAKRR